MVIKVSTSSNPTTISITPENSSIIVAAQESVMSNKVIKTNNNTTSVRVGQQDAIKVISSTNLVLDDLVKIGNVNGDAQATNTFVMFNGTEYIHVDAAEILDLADSISDDTIDYGTF